MNGDTKIVERQTQRAKVNLIEKERYMTFGRYFKLISLKRM